LWAALLGFRWRAVLRALPEVRAGWRCETGGWQLSDELPGEPLQIEHAARAARTYSAASDHSLRPALRFWDRWGAATVERVPLAPGDAVLDLCCGAGASALPAARAVAPDGHVLALDLAACEPASGIFWNAVHAVEPALVRAFNPWDNITTAQALSEMLARGGVRDRADDRTLLAAATIVPPLVASLPGWVGGWCQRSRRGLRVLGGGEKASRNVADDPPLVVGEFVRSQLDNPGDSLEVEDDPRRQSAVRQPGLGHRLTRHAHDVSARGPTVNGPGFQAAAGRG
jgi:hypothetical protein